MTSRQPENEIAADAAWYQKIMRLIRGAAMPARKSPYALAQPLPAQATHNLILDGEPSIRYYTSMTWMMAVLGWETCRQYRWLVNHIMGNGDTFADPSIFDGAELERWLREHPHEQYIWGVFSAFAPDAEIDLSILPDAESPDFWKPNAQPQHPQALFEIVCWDSTCTLFIGLPDKLAQRVVAEFPECRTLDKAIDETACGA